MKISIVYDFLKELGGLERVMVFQSNLLSKKNDVELVFGYVSDKEKGIISKELKLNDKISIKQIGKGKNEIVQLIKLFLNNRKLDNLKTDLIVSHSFMATKMAYKKSKEDKTPYIVVMHHPPNFLYSNSLDWANNVPRFFAYLLGKFIGPIMKKIDKKAVTKSNFVIVNSNYTARRIKEIYKINLFI